MAPAVVEPQPPTTAVTPSVANVRTLATAWAGLAASSRVVRSILRPEIPPVLFTYLIQAFSPWLGGAQSAASTPVRLVDWPSLIGPVGAAEPPPLPPLPPLLPHAASNMPSRMAAVPGNSQARVVFLFCIISFLLSCPGLQDLAPVVPSCRKPES